MEKDLFFSKLCKKKKIYCYISFLFHRWRNRLNKVKYLWLFIVSLSLSLWHLCDYSTNMVFKTTIAFGAQTFGDPKIQKSQKTPASSLCTYAIAKPIHPSYTLEYASGDPPTHPSPLRTFYVHSPFQRFVINRVI